jgi:gas vesicle protein
LPSHAPLSGKLPTGSRKSSINSLKAVLVSLLGTASSRHSLRLLDSLRDRLPDNMDDIKGRVQDTYSTASDRVSRATDALRGEEESHIFGKAVALAIGVGIGIGIGVLIAPASGEETRADIAAKVSDIGDKVHAHSGSKPPSATGTHGE